MFSESLERGFSNLAELKSPNADTKSMMFPGKENRESQYTGAEKTLILYIVRTSQHAVHQVAVRALLLLRQHVQARHGLIRSM